jgi:polyribonucleotide nucleotidyltransferase
MMTNLKSTIAAIVAKFESEEIVAKFKDYTIGEGEESVVVRVDGEELEVGVKVSVVSVDSEGVEQITPAPDGEHIIEDKVIVVVDGVVTEIKDVEEEEASEEEEEVLEDVMPASSEFAEVVEGFERLAAKLVELKEELKEVKEANAVFKSDLEKFAAQPAVQSLEVPKKINKADMSITDILSNK